MSEGCARLVWQPQPRRAWVANAVLSYLARSGRRVRPLGGAWSLIHLPLPVLLMNLDCTPTTHTVFLAEKEDIFDLLQCPTDVQIELAGGLQGSTACGAALADLRAADADLAEHERGWMMTWMMTSPRRGLVQVQRRVVV